MAVRIARAVFSCVVALALVLPGVSSAAPPPQASLKKHPVMLVHGFGGLARDWGDTSVWRKLSDDGYDMGLVARFEFPYRSGTQEEDSSGDVAQIANKLMKDIGALSQKSVAAGGPAKVDLVVYSMGGPITRYYMGRTTPDGNGTVYGSNVGLLIEVAAANNGSYLMALWEASTGGAVPSGIPDLPIRDPSLSHTVMDALINQILPRLKVGLPNVGSIGAHQMLPNSPILQEINNPNTSPRDVDYHALYGDIGLRFQMDFFGWPVISQELVTLGDLAVSRGSATTIPGIGSLEQTQSGKYHSYAYPATFIAKVSLTLNGIGYQWPDPLADIQAAFAVNHLALNGNDAVKSRILAILNAAAATQPPAKAPGPAITPRTGGGSATMLILDVSSTMGNKDPSGSIKIDASRNAAGSIVDMIAEESKVTGVAHQVGIVTFANDASLALPLTSDFVRARDVLSRMSANGSTNLGGGLAAGNTELQKATAGKRIAILLTDGLNNTGMNNAQVLSGPVRDASAAGTCIYTVGFGAPGDLDESFLGQVASGSGCGQYYAARQAYQLEAVYAKLRHESLGTVLGEFQGQVAQSATLSVGHVQVPTGQSEVYVSLNWPGSTLDLIVTDPRGRRVDPSYPGASIVTGARLVYLIIRSPIAGLWQLGVYGRDVPEGTINYNAIASARQGTAAAAGDNSGAFLASFLVLAVGVAVGVAWLASRRRPARARGGQSRPRLGPPAPGDSSITMVTGPLAGQSFGLTDPAITIGRDVGNLLALNDGKVSRQHAVLRRAPGGLEVVDLSSRNGTRVNGARIQKRLLRSGDRVRIGGTEFTYSDGRPPVK